MENQINSQNYYKRKIAAIIAFSVLFIFLGRQLTFLPQINLSTKQGNEEIKESIQKITKEKKGFYSIYYKDLKSGESFGIDENQIETAASINKMPVIAALYYLANKGEVSLDDKITIQKEDLQDYGTGSIRYQSMPQVYSLRNLAKLSLKESDNTAAHVISVRIGTDKIQDLINQWGLKQTNMENNQTSTYDMNLLFEKIYKGEITDPSNTKELMSFMQGTDFEDRLAKNLPTSVKVFHKTGDGEGFIHDVGIIQTNKNTYFLGIMTSDIGDQETATKDAIGQISKKIFDSIEN